ncbi:hypothetical protein [Yersinia sp. 1652 StPb PI]|uniref:hypothetical protein n=1 Tax=unclassified Yersinia (in: enterobacteria) TaxID=2653513 RepID=UPI00355B0D45
MEVAETIRLQLLEQKIPHTGFSVYPFVSVSLGVCFKLTCNCIRQKEMAGTTPVVCPIN